MTFGYDGLGRRVTGTEPGWNNPDYTIYDGDTPIGEVNRAGLSFAYTWGANGLVSENENGVSLWYAFGPQGETRQLTNVSGAVADAYVFTAYGEPVATSGAGDWNTFLYGGQVGYYSYAGGSLVQCGARWYDPYLARWLTRDPIGYDGGDNLYRYCADNPVNLADPAGCFGWRAGVGAVVGGLIGAGIVAATGGAALPIIAAGALGGGLGGVGGGHFDPAPQRTSPIHNFVVGSGIGAGIGVGGAWLAGLGGGAASAGACGAGMNLYRCVEGPEEKAIEESGVFGPASSGMEVKQFWTSLEDAQQYAAKLPPHWGEQTIYKTSINPELGYLQDLDGGKAFNVPVANIPNLAPPIRLGVWPPK